MERKPVNFQDKIAKHLSCKPEHAESVRLRLQNRAKERKKIAASSHLPALARTSEQGSKVCVRNYGSARYNCISRPPCERRRCERRVRRSDYRKERRTGNIDVI